MTRFAKTLALFAVLTVVLCPMLAMDISDGSDAVKSEGKIGYGEGSGMEVTYTEGHDKDGEYVGMYYLKVFKLSDFNKEMTITIDSDTVPLVKDYLVSTGCRIAGPVLSSGSHYIELADDSRHKAYADFEVGPNVESFSIKDNSRTVSVGDSFTLEAAVSPSDAFTGGLTWTSSDPDVATVDQDGNVKALKAGTVFIKAVCKFTGDQATCSIGVDAEPLPIPDPDPEPGSGNNDLVLYASVAAFSGICVVIGAVILIRRR